MTVRDSRTQARARTPGAEDDPTSTTVRDRALGPTQCGISDVATKGHEGRTQTKYLPVYAGSRLKLAMCGKAPSEMSALQPYRGKPAVRNDRGDRGNVGIIEARSAPRSYPTEMVASLVPREVLLETATSELSDIELDDMILRLREQLGKPQEPLLIEAKAIDDREPAGPDKRY